MTTLHCDGYERYRVCTSVYTFRVYSEFVCLIDVTKFEGFSLPEVVGVGCFVNASPSCYSLFTHTTSQVSWLE